MHTPTHPQAIVAVFLASHHDMPRDCVARELHITRTPALYIPWPAYYVPRRSWMRLHPCPLLHQPLDQ